MHKIIFGLILPIVLTLMSCDTPMKKIEVNESFTTTSTYAPFQDDEMLLRMMNNTSMNMAAEEGKDSTTMLAYKDSSGNVDAPKFKDVYFFPVRTDSSLIKDLEYASGMELPSLSSDLDADTMRVHLMDFSKHFAFVVTHPPLEHDFTNTLYITDTSSHILFVALDYIGIPHGQIGTLPDHWQTSVYELPKNKFDSIGVLTINDTTFFSLKK